MAVTFDAKFEKALADTASPMSFVSTSGTVTGSVGNQANRVLIGIVGFSVNVAGIAAVAMTWNSVAMTAIASADAGTKSVHLFGLIAPTIGAQTLAVTWAAGTHDVVLGAVSVYNAHQTTGWQNNTSATGTSTSASVTITSASGNMAVAGLIDNNASSAVIAAGTKDWDERSLDSNYGGGHNASVSSSTAVTWTLGTSVLWRVIGLDVIAAAGGGDLNIGVGAIGEPVVGGSTF